jgi:hypothetical protein
VQSPFAVDETSSSPDFSPSGTLGEERLDATVTSWQWARTALFVSTRVSRLSRQYEVEHRGWAAIGVAK